MPLRITLLATFAALPILGAALALGGARDGRSGSTAAETEATASPQDDITEALREIVKIRDGQIDRVKGLVDSGRASSRDLADARIHSLEAGIRLALAENRPAGAIELARQIIDIRAEMLELLKAQPERADADAVDQARIDHAEARIRLAELELARSAGH